MTSKSYLREHSSILLWMMRLTDITVSLAFCALAYSMVFYDRPPPPSILNYQIAVMISVLLQILLFHAFDLYRAWRGIDYMQEFVAVLLAWSIVFAIQILLVVLTKTTESFSRAWLLIWFAGGGTSLLMMRFALRSVLRKMRARGYNLRHIIILSAGSLGEQVLENLRNSPDSGFNVMGYYSATPSDSTIDIPQQGTIEEGLAFVADNPTDQVWLTMPLKEEELIEGIMARLRNETADIRLVPDLFGFRLINHSISTIANMSVINLSVTPMDGVNRWIKAAEDKLLSALILLLISPLLMLIAIAVKMSSPGPTFYKQTRISWGGKAFEMYKFRTMPVNIEDESGPVWATSGENRATRVGSFLRRTSLDELPQFWNVLKGDMSIVGPRPERKVFVDKFKGEIPSYMQKHMVKAGITGWAQIHGWRGDTDLKKRVEHDLYYIDNWSLWLDLKIILFTLVKGFVHKNAY